ncbi:Transcriptional regulatory protein DegU [Shimia sp. SK013]|uniref:LuxR C-terminal-related transcriptional regulator n=1 Tax=Shimia sp. SK013 TaxID=1389006 RepID=UPI0006B52874|nr:response regulator transcription factor [Shimia sp. SK013]KPA21007.1 Transcriptional regulatory protein DegU [Shimia sp. SK013]
MLILIADDHDLLRDTLVAYVQTAGGIDVLTAPTLDQAMAVIHNDGPFDLVLLDYNMPGMNRLAGLRRVLDLPDGPRVALISGEAPRAVVQEAIDAGAAGFVPKTLPAKSLVNAIRFMAAGEQFVPLDLLAPAEPSTHPMAKHLTKRELQVLGGLTNGKSNKEIARDLGLSEPTVKLHVKNLYRKVGASNRTQAALLAREAKLF